MEAFRDTIPKQSKQADSISFHVTIELFCLFKNYHFLVKYKELFPISRIVFKIHRCELHFRFIYSSVKSRLICSGEEHVWSVIKRGSFHQYWPKFVYSARAGWDHYNSFLLYLCHQRQFWRPLFKKWVGFDPLPPNFLALYGIFVHSSSHSVLTPHWNSIMPRLPIGK